MKTYNAVLSVGLGHSELVRHLHSVVFAVLWCPGEDWVRTDSKLVRLESDGKVWGKGDLDDLARRTWQR